MAQDLHIPALVSVSVRLIAKASSCPQLADSRH
jgi:hypothetical protein